jgi:IMP dehydrogenase/GMP reductase
MIRKIGIGVIIGKLSVESESEEYVEIDQIEGSFGKKKTYFLLKK